MNANVCVDVPCRRLITDSKVKLKYQHLITNSFVEVRWPDILATQHAIYGFMPRLSRSVSVLILFCVFPVSVIDC